MNAKTQQQQYTREYSVDGISVRTSLKPPVAGEIFYVSSESDPEKEYVVRLRKTYPPYLTSDVYVCSCPDFFFREFAAGRYCKHIVAVQALARLTNNNPFSLAAQLRSF